MSNKSPNGFVSILPAFHIFRMGGRLTSVARNLMGLRIELVAFILPLDQRVGASEGRVFFYTRCLRDACFALHKGVPNMSTSRKRRIESVGKLKERCLRQVNGIYIYIYPLRATFTTAGIRAIARIVYVRCVPGKLSEESTVKKA